MSQKPNWWDICWMTLNNTCRSNSPFWFQAQNQYLPYKHTPYLPLPHSSSNVNCFGVLMYPLDSIPFCWSSWWHLHLHIYGLPSNLFIFQPGNLEAASVHRVHDCCNADSCQWTPRMFSCSTSFSTKSDTNENNRWLLPSSVMTFIRIIAALWLQVLDYVMSVIVVHLQLHRGYHIKPVMYTQLPTSSRCFQVINVIHWSFQIPVILFFSHSPSPNHNAPSHYRWPCLHHIFICTSLFRTRHKFFKELRVAEKYLQRHHSWF